MFTMPPYWLLSLELFNYPLFNYPPPIEGQPESKNLSCEDLVNFVANQVFNYPLPSIEAQSEFGVGWIMK